MIGSSEFAVVDVETTGFCPNAHDRVIEIAVLRVDCRGEILGEYASLVNPSRDLGPTHVHGIRARDVRAAPNFEDVAGDVLSLLDDAVFVAHNASFDWRFVHSELARQDIQLPSVRVLCTMRLARIADPSISSRNLGKLCRHFGISVGGSHSAYDDAFATANLLWTCIRRIGDLQTSLEEAGAVVRGDPTETWPSVLRTGKAYTRKQAGIEYLREESFIASLVDRLPARGHSAPHIDDYLSLLDRILEDRRVDVEEVQQLSSVADEFGISREQAAAAHGQYLQDLVGLALEDGVITESERRDLEDVRRLLGVSKDEYVGRLNIETKDRSSGPPRKRDTRDDPKIAGKSICFTGTMTSRVAGGKVNRGFAEGVATGHGMQVRRGVTKDLDFLVVADPDSMSRKAKKARDYGVRVIAEPVFWKMVGVEVE